MQMYEQPSGEWMAMKGAPHRKNDDLELMICCTAGKWSFNFIHRTGIFWGCVYFLSLPSATINHRWSMTHKSSTHSLAYVIYEIQIMLPNCGAQTLACACSKSVGDKLEFIDASWIGEECIIRYRRVHIICICVTIAMPYSQLYISHNATSVICTASAFCMKPLSLIAFHSILLVESFCQRTTINSIADVAACNRVTRRLI